MDTISSVPIFGEDSQSLQAVRHLLEKSGFNFGLALSCGKSLDSTALKPARQIWSCSIFPIAMSMAIKRVSALKTSDGSTDGRLRAVFPDQRPVWRSGG